MPQPGGAGRVRVGVRGHEPAAGRAGDQASEHRQPDGSYKDLYPALHRAYAEGRAPKPGWNPRCPNKVRYEMLTRLEQRRGARPTG
mgnify:CR=1 FL=1